MGEAGPRRSTLVSRLPIFRRSASKRQDSLPSSPSSGGVANGVHTSSPSSTNSSSSSTGKRRSLFRAPSISFHSKRNSEPPRVDPAQLPQDNGGSAPESDFSRADDGGRSKTRHSFGFGGHRHKKITRSQTEDFEKASANRNPFMNCISSGTNEGDDSGFLDDYSSRRSSRPRKQLLPKSFSSHHRFSKHPVCTPEQCRSLGTGADPPKPLTPGSCPSELGGCSLPSPMPSEDRTTAVTPSEFVPGAEDSISEVDALPVLSPATPSERLCPVVPASQVFFMPQQSATEKPLLPDTSTVSTECETAVPGARPEPPLAPEGPEESPAEVASHVEPVSENSEPSGADPEKPGEETERGARNSYLAQELRRGACSFKPESRPCHLRKPHTVSVGSSSSPYHEVLRMERRLRSASEGAGGPRLHMGLREPASAEGQALLKHRADSSSSKLGSLDVLNNLGSSELDEDDLMLDLDLSDDQRQRHVSREDSSQSISSCLVLLPSPAEHTAEKTLGKESKGAEPPHRARPTSLLPADWCLPRDEEGLPFRQMQQDCTALKTLLLRLRRTLQESTDTSPASSLHSLPISPCSEKSLPFKDSGREESASLLPQLKDKDELILRLQSELEKARAAQKPPCQKADKSTQTELVSPEVACPSLAASLAANGRDRRAPRALVTEAHHRAGVGEDRRGPAPAGPARRLEGPQAWEGARKADAPASQIPRVVSGSSSSLAGRCSPSRSLSSDSERSSAPRQPSAFAGRLGQPPRGPLSLHMYSRKNVFLQHSLHSAELQALTQQDS